ncbi:MAG: YihY/virulence factor BrkB family protein [Desulfatiglandaceae bacterium]
MRILLKSVVDFFKDEGPMYAGGISCFFMMAIVPFLILLVSILGYILGQDNELYHFFLSQLSSFFPSATQQIAKELKSIIGFKQIAISNLLVYAIFSYQLYVSLEKAIQLIFRVEEKRSLVFSLLFSFFVITLLVFFTMVSFGVSWIISLLEPIQELFPELRVGMAAGILSRFLIPVLLVFFVTTTLYILLPPKRVRLIHALLGGLHTAVFFEAAKHLFTVYTTMKVSQLGTIYGSLTAIVTFLMWLFFSSSIFLIGAELVRNLENNRNGVGEGDKPVILDSKHIKTAP